MTGRERIMAVIKGETPDRIPFVPALTPYFLETMPEEIRTDDAIEACRILGADIAERWIPTFKGFHLDSAWNLDFFDPQVLKDANIKMKEDKDCTSTHRTFKTPVGILTEKITKNEDAGATTFREEVLIKTKEDLRVYKYLWEAKYPSPVYGATRKVLDYVGEDGIGMALIPATPILQLIMYDLGIEKLAYFLTDYTKEMEKLFGIMEEKCLEAARIAASSPAEVGLICENSGTRLVSPKQFEAYCKPLISEYSKIYKQNNKFIFMHACGHLKGLLDQIVEIDGLSGLESLTPPPTGDVTLDYSISHMRPKDMTIMGGMDPVQFLNLKPYEVEDMVKDIIEKVKPGKYFMLMPADSTAANTPVENFYTINKTIGEFGKWSK